ncbi:hypothetical protein, partial [Kibdelosporangium philippinense]
MKRIVWSSVALLFGLLFIVGGSFALFDDTVTCGGETMRQGDVCVREKNGTVVSESNLDESRTDGLIGKIIGIGMGLALIAIGAHNMRLGIRARKAGPHQPATFNGHGGYHPAPTPWPQPPNGPQSWQQNQTQQVQYQQHMPLIRKSMVSGQAEGTRRSAA